MDAILFLRRKKVMYVYIYIHTHKYMCVYTHRGIELYIKVFIQKFIVKLRL